MNYAYYPGCSLECNASAYDASVREVADVLGIRLVELDDWNCCGATEYFSQDELTACAVIARNLALVDPAMDQLVAPCAACYLNLRKVDHLMGAQPSLGERINQALAAGGLKYQPGRVRVRHMLDVICDDIGEKAVREQVVRPLAGLKLAPYYGCQVVRPLDNGDSPEYPMKMDYLLKWLGAEVVDFPAKAHCCGGHLTQISEPHAFELINRLLHGAQRVDADMIICMCPMCQVNLDGYQARVNKFFNLNYKLPILYFTQLLGVAFGIEPAKLGFGKELVTALPVLEAKLDGQIAAV